jgi:hypothetical protein
MVNRTPRPKCAQRNKEYLNDIHFPQVAKELTPLLFKCASKISRPYYIDNSDLVQEALAHIFCNRDKYDETMSSIMTWCITVAKNKFINIASTGFRDKRCAKDADNNVLGNANFDEIIYFSADDGGCLSNAVVFPTIEDDIHERELISKTKNILRGFSKQVLEIYLNPPDDLVTLVNIRETRQGYRVKRINNQNVSSGVQDKHKAPFSFHIDNESLAIFMNVSKNKVAKAKDEIYGALRKASKECEGCWPTVSI